MANPVVESYRQWAASQGIRDWRDDAAITREIGDRLQEQGRLTDLNEQYPDFREDYLDARREDAPGVFTEFGRGVQRGVQRGGVALGAAGQLIGRTIGSEGLTEAAEEFTQKRAESLQEIEGPSIESHRDIRTPGDAFRWLAGVGGESVPVMAAMAGVSAAGALAGTAAAGPVGTVSGGVGTAIGTRLIAQQAMRRMVQRGVERTAARAASARVASLAGSQLQRKALRGAIAKGGALAGGFLPLEVSYVGDFYNNAIEQGAAHDVAARNALLFGTPAALVETVYPARVGALLMRKLAREGGEGAARKVFKDRVKGVLREAGVGGAMEGSAETMAEAFMIAGEMATIPGYEITPEQIRSRLEHAFVAGSALGSLFGGAAGAAPSRTRTAGDASDGAQRNALDEVIDQILETTEHPAAEMEMGSQVAADIASRPENQRTPEEQEYIEWWERNLEQIERETRSPDALQRLNQVLAADEMISAQDARLEGRREQMFDVPVLEPGTPPIDPFAMPQADPAPDPRLVEPAPPADPSQVVAGSPIDARRETVAFGQIDPDTRAALEDATVLTEDPFVLPPTEATTDSVETGGSPVVETTTQPSELALPGSQPQDVAAEAGRPNLLGMAAETTATEGTPETLLVTNLIPFDAADTQAVTRAALTEGQTASQTRNFIVVQNADGTVETRGVFRQAGQELVHNKESRVSEADIARETGVSKPTVSRTLKEYRETGELRGKTDRTREQSRRIVETAERLGYDPSPAFVRLADVSGRDGSQVIGYFQTNQTPPRLFQRFASRAEFDAAMDRALSRSWQETTVTDETGRRRRVPTDPLAETRAEVEQLSRMTPEEQRRVAERQRMEAQRATPETMPDGTRTVAIDDVAATEPTRGAISADVASANMVAEDSGPDVGPIYSRLMRTETSAQLIDNLGGVSGILGMMRGTPEQVRTRLRNEVAKLLPEGQRRQWMGEGIPDDVREAFTDLQNRQLDGLASDLQGMAEKGIFYRKQRVDEHRLSNEELRNRFANVAYTLARLGVTLDIRSPDTNAADPFWHGEGGRYIPSNRTVELAIEDTLAPTERNLRDLMHELAHDVFQNEPQHIQEMLQDMIARMDPNDLAFHGEARADPRARIDDPAGLGRRVVTEEMLVEHLTWQGLDADTARGLVRRLIDAVKEMLLKAALQFQRAFTLSEPVSDWLAREYIETRWQRMLDGRPIPNAESLLARLGGRKLTYSETAHFFTLTTPGGFTETVDPFTGEITPATVLADSPEAIAHNRNAILAAEQAQSIHERDAEMEVAEVLLRREMEDAGMIPSPEQDRAYMEAVERGDIATAQRMVDEAARAAGYTVKAYHGTLKSFNRFRIDDIREFQEHRPELTSDNRFAAMFSTREAEASKYGGQVIPVWLRVANPKYENQYLVRGAPYNFRAGLTKPLVERGYDALYFGSRDINKAREIAVFDPNQIKSADPVTYDDAGNVIPLSQRFNPQSPDIRYRQEGSGKTRAQIVAEARAENQRRRLRQNALVSIAENNEISRFVDATLDRMRVDEPNLTRDELLSRMGIAHDPRSLAQQEADAQAATGDPVSVDTTLNSLPDEARAQAEMKALGRVNKIQRDLSERTGKLTREIRTNTARLEARQADFKEAAANVADLKAVERQIRRALLDSIEETRKAIKAQSRGDEAAGSAAGVLRTLLNLQNDQAIPANYERVLNNLVTDETPIFSYIRHLRRFSEDHVDFAGHTVREIRQEIINRVNRGDNTLADLVRGERGTALLSTLISFVKNEAHLAAAMEVQRMDATIQQAVVRDIQSILKLNTERELAQLRDRAKAMPRSVQNNLIVSYVNKRRELIALERKLEADQNRLKATEQGVKEAKRLSDELGSRHNVRVETPLVDGAVLIVPAKPDVTTAEIEAGGEGNPNFVTLRVGGSGPTSNAQKTRWVEQMKRFVEYRESLNDPAALDTVYRTVKADAERLGRQVLQDAVYPYRKGWLDQMRHSIVQQLRKSGLPAARMAASMFERREAIVKPNEARAIIHGSRWEGLESRLLKRARVSQEFFMQNIWNPAGHWLGLEAMAGREASLADLREFLFADPMVRDALGREGAWQTFVELLEHTDATNKWFTEDVLVKNGLAIRDDSLETWFNPVTKREEYFTRSLVKGGTMIIPRSLSDTARVAINEMARLGWWRTDADRAAFIRQLREDPEQAQVKLAGMITPTIQANFIEPLIHNDAGTILDRPVGADGIRAKADPALIAEAWGESNGDLIAFGRRLYELHTGDTANLDAATKYAGEILDTIGKYHKRMAEEYVGDISDETGTEVSTDKVSYASINARTAYDLPSQFFTYERFGKDDNRFRLQQVASQAVFGRDFQELFNLFDRMEADLRLRKDALDSKTSDLIRENPSLDSDRKGLERELKKAFGKDWELYRDLDDALRVFNARRLKEQVKAMFGNHNGMTNDFRTFQHVMNFVVGQLVNNPKTGLKNMTSNNDIMRVFGVNKVTMRAAASAWAETGRQGWATLASLIGRNVLENREKWMQIDAAGFGLDYAGELSLRDILSQRGPMGQWDRQGFGGKVKKALAITSDLMQNTIINPAGARQRAVTFRPFAPFQMSQLASNRTAVYGMVRAYETYARKIAEFYQKNPHRLNDPDYEVTARDIGETKPQDRSVFEKMADQAKLHGFTMEEIGRAAYANPDKSRFPFDTDLVQKIGQIAISHVSMESNLTNRPVGSLTSQLGRMSIPLVGWSIESFNTTTNMMRDASNARTLASSAIGLAGLMAVVVPLAVLYSFAFDEYDRRLLGKQPNIRPMNPSAIVNNPHEAVMGLIERVNAMGPFGIGGEALAGIATIRDSTEQKVLSVDERVVWVNTLGRLIDAIGTVNAQGITNTTYASVWRQLFQSTMGSGAMQAMQMTNTMLGHPPIPGLRAESGVTQRINVQNWLRATGRNLGMEVRTAGGFARPTRVTPHVTNMQLAAFRDDPEAFQRAYRRAIEEARKMGRDDATDYVKRSYQHRHPLRNVFRTAPSTTEYRKLLEAMPRIGREATQAAITSYNRYGQRLGLTPYTGSTGSGGGRSSGEFASAFSATDFGAALGDAFSVDW